MRFHCSALRQIWAVTLALTLLACSAGWAGEPALNLTEQSWLKAHPVIRMSVDVGYGPYTFLDVEGRLQGVAVEFFADIERYLGIRFEIVSNLSWSQQMEALRERRLDVVATVVRLPEREAFIEFTEIYLSTPLVIMTRSATSQLRSLKELQQLSLSLVEGYSSSKQLIEQFPDLRPRYVTMPLEGLRLVASGATDAYVGVLGVNSFLAVRNGITNLKVNAAFNMADNGQRFGVRKDWPQLARLLDKALLSISEERRNAVFQRWLPRHVGEIKRLSQPSYATRLFPWLLGCLGLALLSYFILFIFNRRLHKTVAIRTQELLRTNEKLRDSEQKFRSLSGNILDLIYRAKNDKDWTAIYVNDGAERLVGYPASDFIDNKIRSLASLIHPEDMEYVNTKIQEALDKKNNFNIEYRIIHNSGNIVWVNEKGSGIYNGAGDLIYIDGITSDITERKQMETELKMHRDHLEKLVEERTVAFDTKVEELEQMNDVFVGREFRIKELRDRVEELELKIGS